MMASMGLLFCCSQLISAGDSLRMIEMDGGEHPDLHVDGFVLRSMYMYAVSRDEKPKTLITRKMKFNEHAHLCNIEKINARRKLLQFPELGATLSSREQIVALTRLNWLAYPDEILSNWTSDVLGPIYQAGDGRFGQSLDMEVTNIQALRNAIKAELDETAGVSWSNDYTPSSARDTIGIAALEFTRGNLTVLAFRGSFTPGDFANIQNWVIDWVLGSMTAQMKRIWIEQAGLDWGSDLETGQQQSTLKQVIALNLINAFLTPFGSTSFASDLASAVAGLANLSLTAGDAASTGYWTLDKYVADAARRAAAERGGPLLLSGQSQGGTRAQLMSMYLRKRYNETHNGITFGATGAQCMARRLDTGANLLGPPPTPPPPRRRPHPHPHPAAAAAAAAADLRWRGCVR